MESAAGLAQISGDTLQKGGAWGLLAIAFVVIVYLFKAWRDEATARLDDWKEITKALNANSLAISSLTSSNDARNRTIEASVRSQELAVAAQVTLSTNVNNLTTEISDLRSEAKQTREALLERGLPR